MSRMEGLQEIVVELDAYLEHRCMSPLLEADIFVPMVMVKTPQTFQVRLLWPGPETTILQDVPFTIERVIHGGPKASFEENGDAIKQVYHIFFTWDRIWLTDITRVDLAQLLNEVYVVL